MGYEVEYHSKYQAGYQPEGRVCTAARRLIPSLIEGCLIRGLLLLLLINVYVSNRVTDVYIEKSYQVRNGLQYWNSKTISIHLFLSSLFFELPRFYCKAFFLLL